MAHCFNYRIVRRPLIFIHVCEGLAHMEEKMKERLKGPSMQDALQQTQQPLSTARWLLAFDPKMRQTWSGTAAGHGPEVRRIQLMEVGTSCHKNDRIFLCQCAKVHPCSSSAALKPCPGCISEEHCHVQRHGALLSGCADIAIDQLVTTGNVFVFQQCIQRF